MLCVTEQIDRRCGDNVLLGKHSLRLMPRQRCNLITAKSKYMNSCSWTLIKDAHHTAPSWNEAFAASLVRVMTITHTASFHCLVACLATHTWDLEEAKAIVFNHPGGEHRLEKTRSSDQWLASERLHPDVTLLTSLSSSPYTCSHAISKSTLLERYSALSAGSKQREL